MMVTIRLARFIQMLIMTIFNVQTKRKGFKDSNIGRFGLTIAYGMQHTVAYHMSDTI